MISLRIVALCKSSTTEVGKGPLEKTSSTTLVLFGEVLRSCTELLVPIDNHCDPGPSFEPSIHVYPSICLCNIKQEACYKVAYLE